MESRRIQSHITLQAAWTRKDGLCANTYLKGFWRNDPSGSTGIWLLEEGKCCAASEPSYTNHLQPVEMKTGGVRLMGGLLEYAAFKGTLMMKGQ